MSAAQQSGLPYEDNGFRFGDWTVRGEAPQRGKHTYVFAECKCGIWAEVRLTSLVSGGSESCRACSIRTHGQGSMRAGMSPAYKSWTGMIQRCHNEKNPSYQDYGGRGITVHADWRGPGGFELFFAHVGPRPAPGLSIDRIDNSRGYEPGNLRWATRSVQMRNRRGSGIEYRTRVGGRLAPGSTRRRA